jgi:hypothetical protein
MWDYPPGQSGNSAGRPVGSRNKRDAEIWARLEARGDLDPADLLSSIVTNKDDPKELRAQAANMLLPYKYSKRAALPPARFVVDAVWQGKVKRNFVCLVGGSLSEDGRLYVGGCSLILNVKRYRHLCR